MAQLVVHPLEVINIEEEKTQRMTLSLGPLPFVLQLFIKPAPVRHMGQPVGKADCPELFIGALQFVSAFLDAHLQGQVGLLLDRQRLLLGFMAFTTLEVDPVGEGKRQQNHLQRHTDLRH